MENMNTEVNETQVAPDVATATPAAAPELAAKPDAKVVETIAQYLLDKLTCCSTGTIQERMELGVKQRAVNEPTKVRSMTLEVQDIMSGISWYCREQDPSSTVVPNNQLIRDVAVKFNELILADKGYSCLAYLHRQEVKHVLAKGEMLSPIVAMHEAAVFKPWVYDKLTAYTIRVIENGVTKYHGDTYLVKRKDDVQSANRDVFEDNKEFIVAYYDPHVATIMASLITERLESEDKTFDVDIVPVNLTFLNYYKEDTIFQDKGISAYFIPKNVFAELPDDAVIEVDRDYSDFDLVENEHNVDLRLIASSTRTLIYAASGLKGREDAPQVSQALYDVVLKVTETHQPPVFDRVIDVAVFGSDYTLYYIVNDTKVLTEDAINKETSVDDLLMLDNRVREYIDDHGLIYVTAHRLATDSSVDFLPFKDGYYYLNHAYLTHLLANTVPLTEVYHQRQGNDYFVAITKSYGCDRDEAADIDMPFMRECYRLSVDEVPEWLKLRDLTIPYWKPTMNYFHGALDISSYPVATDEGKDYFTETYMLCVPKDKVKNTDDLMAYLGNHPYRDFVSVFSYAGGDNVRDDDLWRKDYVKDIERLIKREIDFTDDVMSVCSPITEVDEIMVSEDIHGNLYLTIVEPSGLEG